MLLACVSVQWPRDQLHTAGAGGPATAQSQVVHQYGLLVAGRLFLAARAPVVRCPLRAECHHLVVQLQPSQAVRVPPLQHLKLGLVPYLSCQSGWQRRAAHLVLE